MYFYQPDGTQYKLPNVQMDHKCSYYEPSFNNTQLYEKFDDTESLRSIKNVGLNERIKISGTCFTNNGNTYCLDEDQMKKYTKKLRKLDSSKNKKQLTKQLVTPPITPPINQSVAQTNDTVLSQFMSLYKILASGSAVTGKTNEKDNKENIKYLGTFDNPSLCGDVCNKNDDCFGFSYYNNEATSNDLKKKCYSIGNQNIKYLRNTIDDDNSGATTYLLKGEKWYNGLRIVVHLINENRIIANFIKNINVRDSSTNGINYDDVNDPRNFLKLNIDDKKFGIIRGNTKGDNNINMTQIFWSGYIKVSKSGKYKFFTESNDGVCVYLNDMPIIRAWNDDRPNKNASEIILLEENIYYPFQYAYYNAKGESTNNFSYTLDNGQKTNFPPEWFYNKVNRPTDHIVLIDPLGNTCEKTYRVDSNMYPSLMSIKATSYSLFIRMNIKQTDPNWHRNVFHWGVDNADISRHPSIFINPRLFALHIRTDTVTQKNVGFNQINVPSGVFFNLIVTFSGLNMIVYINGEIKDMITLPSEPIINNSSFVWFRNSTYSLIKNALEISHCVIIPYSIDDSNEAIKIGKKYVK
jgi:hypothetical protein